VGDGGGGGGEAGRERSPSPGEGSEDLGSIVREEIALNWGGSSSPQGSNDGIPGAEAAAEAGLARVDADDVDPLPALREVEVDGVRVPPAGFVVGDPPQLPHDND